MKVYLAGKVSKYGWRAEIIPHFRNEATGVCGEDDPGAHRYKEVEVEPYLVVVGPWFVSCDHGCFHGRNSHGQLATPQLCGCGHGCSGDGFCAAKNAVRDHVAENARSQIDRADVVLAHFDEPEVCTAYGTLIELGYAAARRKRIFVSGCFSHDLWFVKHFVSPVKTYPCLLQAWNRIKNEALQTA